MALEDNTKKDLAQMVRDLQEKLKELKPVESAQVSQLADLSSHGIGLLKDENGKFSLVKLKFDVSLNAAAIETLEHLNSTDPAIAHYKLTQYVAEVIVRKTRGGKYD